MIPAIISGVSNLLSGFINQGFNERNMELQSRYAQNLADYQWRNFQSPKAQVEALDAAGINPGTIFGEKGGSFLPSPSINMPSSAPVSVPPVFSLSDMSNYIQSVASAKKAGMDTKLAEQEISNKEVERQTKEFELGLLKEFGKEFKTVELASAYRNLLLASDSHDLNVQQKAINDWKKVSEKAVAEANEHQRDILSLRLNNEPVAIRLDNELKGEQIKTEKSAQTSNYASASAANASAEQTRIFNKIYGDQRYKHAMITEAVEAGRKAVEERKLTKSQADHMSYMVQQAAFATDMQEFTYWSGQIQSFVHSVGEAASSFYGAGALRELIRLRQFQQVPHQSVTGFAP